MRLHVAAPLRGHGVIVGPAPWFKLVRSTLRMGPAEAQVGQLENKQWKIHGRLFTAFHLDEASTIHFEAAAGTGGGKRQELKLDGGGVAAPNSGSSARIEGSTTPGVGAKKGGLTLGF